MLRLVQLTHIARGRRLARVSGERLELLDDYATAYDLATEALRRQTDLEVLVHTITVNDWLDYDSVHAGDSEWRVLPPFDHPLEPACCRVTGTGLTHLRSAEARSSMHAEMEQETDSIRMYRLGVDGGRPAPGQVGAAPEWFYKGDGSVLRAHGDTLTIPAYACDGGEEAEVAGVYLIDAGGNPRRAGFVIGNEFSDHVLERQNYLYLAHSKLRHCAIGPELLVGARFDDLHGTVSIIRNGGDIWRKQIRSGEQNMAHSLANLEHHHFKYASHRRPGDVHIHFFGADALSCGAGVKLEAGDTVEIGFEDFGRPLHNVIARDDYPERFISVPPL